MAFYTRSELLKVPIYQTAAVRAANYHTKSASVHKYIFLSHSHKDADIVNQAIQILGNEGVKIYVDWKDDTMPSVTSPESAQRIKQKIAGCNKFVLLATNNALASRWVPWELGIADSENSMENVVIMPVREPPHTWNGNEYIGIYQRLEIAESGEPAVFPPGASKGKFLKAWLLQ